VRGTWFGLCPNCGVKMSFSIYALVADCPGCRKNIVREGNRLKVERTT
jgi:Zn-finger nucleic acid-binding protein